MNCRHLGTCNFHARRDFCCDQVQFYKIDIDIPEVEGVAAKFDVSSVVRSRSFQFVVRTGLAQNIENANIGLPTLQPTFNFIKAGSKVDSLIGADPGQLRTLVDKYK